MSQLIAFGLMIVGCFLPWGVLKPDQTTVTLTIGGVSRAVPMDQMGFGLGALPVLPVTAWGSHAVLMGVTFPNWLVLGAGAFLIAFALMECFPRTRVPLVAKLAFSLYGLAHLGALAAAFGKAGTPDIGYVLVILGFVGLLAAMLFGGFTRSSAPMNGPTPVPASE